MSAFQQSYYHIGEARIAIVKHARAPGPRNAHEDRRKAMQRDRRSPPVASGQAPI
jgi:hypothetical protein